MGTLSASRPRKACQRCKELKTRCRSTIDSSSPEDACARCSRLQLDCHYLPSRKRGRRPAKKDRAQAPTRQDEDSVQASLAQPSPEQIGTSSSLDKSTSETNPTQVPTTPDRTPCDGGVLDRASPGSLSSQSSASGSSPMPQRYTGSLTKLGGPAALGTMDHLEPYLGEYDSRPGTPQGRRTATFHENENTSTQIWTPVDPVALGILSEAEASQLFTQAMSIIFVTSYMFDSQHTTYQRTRLHPILFTTILWLASTFFRPTLATLLYGLAETMISRAITSGTHDLGLAQALLITIVWSKPTDKSTRIKLAVVKAILWELRVDDDFKELLPTDPTLARAKLDRERTLIVAFSQNSLNCVIQETRPPLDDWGVTIGQIDSWGPAHHHLGIQGDLVLSFSMNLLHQLGFQSEGTPEPGLDNDWSMKRVAMQHAIDVTLRELPSTGAARHHVAAIGHGIIMNLQLLRWQQSRSTDHLQALLERLGRFIDAFASCASAGIIPYWPYASCVLLSQPAVIIFKMIGSVQGILRAEVRSLLDRCLLICHSLAGLPPDHAIYYVERCYKRVLGVYETVDRQGSNPALDGVILDPEPLDSYYTRLFGFDPDDPTFQYGDWAGVAGEME